MEIKKTKSARLRLAEQRNMVLELENAQLRQITNEQADALIELAALIEEGKSND